MSSHVEQSFRRAFRFHPAAWRARNESVAIGVLMDVAEAEGRDRVRVSELLSLYGHAGNLWLDRVMRVGAREVLASLCLGAGLALSLLMVTGFAVLPAVREEPFPIVSQAVAFLCIAVLWGTLAVATALHATRTRLWLAVIAAASAFLLGMVKLALPEVFLPSWLTLGVLACFAVGSCAARPRNRMVWQSAAVVMALGVFWELWRVLEGSAMPAVDALLWRHIAPWLLLAIAVVMLGALIVAVSGSTGFAVGVSAHMAPWMLLVAATYKLDGQSVATVLALVGAYAVACVLVAGAARKSGRLEVAAL